MTTTNNNKTQVFQNYETNIPLREFKTFDEEGFDINNDMYFLQKDISLLMLKQEMHITFITNEMKFVMKCLKWCLSLTNKLTFYGFPEKSCE